MSKTLKAGKRQNEFRKDGANEPEFGSKRLKMKPFTTKDRI